MRVALAPEGSRGDVQPLLVLGEALRARGCDVVLCGPPDSRELVEARGIEFRALRVDVREFIQTNAAAAVGGSLRLLRAGMRYFREALEQQLPALHEATRDAEVVVGGGAQFGGPSVAEAHGVPYRFVAYCPAILASAEHPPFILERQTRSRRLNRVAWRAFITTYSLAMRRTLNRGRARLGLPAVGDVYSYLIRDRVLLAADPDLAPKPADCRLPVVQVGYLPLDEREELPEKLAAFLEAGPAPVYLGFGSMPDPDPGTTTRRLLDAIAARGCRAVISEGWAGLGRAPLPDGVMAVGPVPHGRLFPRVAAVVHHGGAGTTSTAARAGVPQIVVPHLLDQFYWAERVRRLGLGPPPLPRRRLDAEALAVLLAETLENELVSERARELGERMRARRSVELAVEEILAG